MKISMFEVKNAFQNRKMAKFLMLKMISEHVFKILSGLERTE